MKLDVYLSDERGPSVLLVHGGAFLIGHRRMKPMRILATQLCRLGISCAIADYRRLGRGGRFPNPILDVRDALGYWQERCQHDELDPARISIMGLSAGGSLALLAAGVPHGDPMFEGAAKPLAAPQGVVSVFATTDFSRLQGFGPKIVIPRLTQARGDEIRRRSPISHADFEAPLLLIHGDQDRIVPLAQSQRMADRRAELGRPTTLKIYEGAPHGFFNQDSKQASQAIADIASFLKGVPVTNSETAQL